MSLILTDHFTVFPLLTSEKLNLLFLHFSRAFNYLKWFSSDDTFYSAVPKIDLVTCKPSVMDS